MLTPFRPLTLLTLILCSSTPSLARVDIIPTTDRKPLSDRYIGTPIVKKNGRDFIKFQDCTPIAGSNPPSASCKPIIELPIEALEAAIACWNQKNGVTSSDQLKSAAGMGLILGGGAVAILGMASVIGATPAVMGTAGMVTTGRFMIDSANTKESRQNSFNRDLRAEKLKKGTAYLTLGDADSLVRRVNQISDEIFSDTTCKLDRYRAWITRYGTKSRAVKVAMSEGTVLLLENRSPGINPTEPASGPGEAPKDLAPAAK